MKRRIGIDCRLSGIEHAGIGRYIEELVVRVTKDTSVDWVLFVSRANQLPIEKSDHIKIVKTPVRHYTLREQVFMSVYFLRENLGLLHVPHFNVPIWYPRKYIVTIHDLLWHERQGSGQTTLSPLIYRFKYWAYKIVASLAIIRAAEVIVPAETTKKSILALYPGTKSERLIVTKEGVDRKWRSSDKLSDANNREPKILFYTGSLYPHKNVRLVIRALEQLPGYVLHISSSRNIFLDELKKEIKKLDVEKQVVFRGRLSDEELKETYQKEVFALVQPSFSEGFGLTGLEAMAAGVPVLASEIDIFKEVYGKAFIGFDPSSVDSFVAAVRKLEASDRQTLIELGKEHVEPYSWDKMTKATIEVYNKAQFV